MFIKILVFGFFLFIGSQIVHVVLWRVFSPKAYPIWLPVIFTISPAAFLVLFHLFGFTGFIGIELNQIFYLIIGSSLIMYFALAAMYIHLYPGIVFFSLSLEIIKLLAEQNDRGLSIEEMDLPVLSEANTIGMRIDHLVNSGMIEKNGASYILTPKGIFIARSFYIYRRMLGLPGIGRG